MADKLMITNNDTQTYPSVDYNYWLKSYDTQLNKQTRKCYYKTLGTRVINSPMSPSFLIKALLPTTNPLIARPLD